jgi:hypothetical protein
MKQGLSTSDSLGEIKANLQPSLREKRPSKIQKSQLLLQKPGINGHKALWRVTTHSPFLLTLYEEMGVSE